MGKKKNSTDFKVTYATMFDPPTEVHNLFDEALVYTKTTLGQSFPMLIGEKKVYCDKSFESRSPINEHWLLGSFPSGEAREADMALAEALKAASSWASMKWSKRVDLLRASAKLIEKRIYDIASVVALEVGKNRTEALGEVQETADLINYYCNEMERNNGYVEYLPNDPIKGVKSRNVHMLKPYGVWVVISPFNFPFALAGGPSAAAMLAGNTVIFKPATLTSYSGFLIAKVFRDTGIPDGVFNYVTGSGRTLGEALIKSPDVGGVTFTGSYDVGMNIYRKFAEGKYPRPCIAEMGGKNAAIISRNADLDRAALGVMRSAFGLQGQKCSACSRVYVERLVAKDFLKKLCALTRDISIGDPTDRKNWFGPVISEEACSKFSSYTTSLNRDGGLLSGGHRVFTRKLDSGYFCQPTIAQSKFSHPLWKHEMFLPIVMVGIVDSLDEAMNFANDTDYGLTAGFFGNSDEVEWFFKNIQAGVAYANREHGATAGAWPGFQPFGGWRGSGSTGKGAGGPYYLPQFMREQSQTRVSW
ncbi:MAG: aldehyde dehydrogenase family protein [Patescibacteria group bacterium]